ncbi:MAG TPA: alginate lyase family protein [Streptosporangiaceae bacterium]|nr:alginate lyase family protein [Streptosporangiaceae bacterium]
MSPAEVGWRVRDQVLRAAWSGRQVRRDQEFPAPRGFALERGMLVVLPGRTADLVPEAAKSAVLVSADRLIKGEWEVLGLHRDDMVAPDWFFDPVTGIRAPAERYAFRINHRSQHQTGNIKQIWEVSRLHHLTLLAAAWFFSRDDAYARRVAEQLRSWWRCNPFLSGVHWTSGIEIGIRLISMAWIRRLLDDWPGVGDLFEHNDLAVAQIRWHQQYLAAFRSRGSSANNHVIAEAAGQLVASCVFPWFAESARWRRKAARLLERELIANTFPSGVDRELASDYQYFVAELGLVAAVEAAVAGHPLSAQACGRLCAVVDSGIAMLDESGRPPRQGDGDEGRVLLLDAPGRGGAPSLIALAGAVFGRLDWWPATVADARSSIVGAMPGATHHVGGRPPARPSRFADAGMTILRTASGDEPEIWCRCDGGPHGFLSIAAHAHADALAVEVRCGGVDVLADPGTYCYHGEPDWRSYFRSTIAHNTVEIDGRDQSIDGGPFLWVHHANGKESHVADVGDAVEWTAEHEGYLTLRTPARHRRCVRLDRASRGIDIVDEIDGGSRDIRLAFHFGPDVEVELEQHCAALRWPAASVPGAARIDLPASLNWTLHRGATDRIMGWYSSGLGRRVPAFALVGCGRSMPDMPLCTRLQFMGAGNEKTSNNKLLAVSWLPSDDMWQSSR